MKFKLSKKLIFSFVTHSGLSLALTNEMFHKESSKDLKVAKYPIILKLNIVINRIS